jgi:hypothetical protein
MLRTHGARRPSAPTGETQVVYEVLGVRVGVSSDDPDAIVLIDRSFGALRQPLGSAPTMSVALRRATAEGWVVIGAEGSENPAGVGGAGALALLHQLVVALMAGFQERGLLAVHAAAVARHGRAVVLSGPGGVGKTTLTLALASRGLEILSDELAVLDPAQQLVYPYRRNVHVRPGTPELVDGMANLSNRPREQLGGGIAWAIPHADLGSKLDDEAPRALAGVVMLRPHELDRAEPFIEPLRGSLAAIELMRATWAASRDYAGSLDGLARVVARTPCIALTPGSPMASARAIDAWMRDLDG